MSLYSYKLIKDTEDRPVTKYTRQELEQLTTLQLRDICYKEKLVKGIANSLDRTGFIQTILQFRGSNEDYLIRRNDVTGNTNLKNFLAKKLGESLSDYGKIKQPAKLIFYEDLAVGKRDQYMVETEGLVAESNVLLVDEQYKLRGIFHLIPDEEKKNRYYLCTSGLSEIGEVHNRNFHLLYFDETTSKYLYNLYYQKQDIFENTINYYDIPINNIEIRPLETTSAVLAIDFGTTNTTAGVFLDENYVKSPNENDIANGTIKLNEINYLLFKNTANEKEDDSWLLPTIVSVRDCSSKQGIQFDFGYDAIKHINWTNHCSVASVFHEIKRWVGSYEQMEKVTDYNGNTTEVMRGDVITAYLEHVIHVAEHQVKCRFSKLHISSPVKLKQQSLDMFVQLLPEYQIETEHALDEGIAVLYNTIAGQIERESFVDGESYQALVIDCGGGTTDLSSCVFQIKNGELAYQIDINTTFENGDINFGGNNITYRIMQFMKIAFANYYSGRSDITHIDALFPFPSVEVYRRIDEQGSEKVYQLLEKRYAEVEKIIPTRFKDYEHQSSEAYQMVKANYHFFWRIADEMKKEFFRKTGIQRSTFHDKGLKKEESDLKITIVDSWRFAMNDGGKLRYEYELPRVVFNINEIQTLIKGDIYAVVKKFLEGFFEDGSLQDYSIIKLTGQSCRIDVFRDALKEFVPGRYIDFRQRENSLMDLKLSCLSGVLRYINAKKTGYVRATITNSAPITPYSIIAYKHNKEEHLLIAKLEQINQVSGFISRYIDVQDMEFFLRNSNDETVFKHIYRNDQVNYTPITYEDVNTVYQENIAQDEVDTIADGVVKFFVFASDEKWGFYVLPIARRNGQLLLGERQFFSFESDAWELNFFDGVK